MRQSLYNLEHLPKFMVGLAGIGRGVFGVTGVTQAMQDFDWLRVVIIIGGPLLILISLPRRIARSRRSGKGMSYGEILDCVVLIAFVTDLVLFVMLPITSSPAYGRYLSASIIFGALLAARAVIRLLDGRAGRVLIGSLAVTLACCGVFAYGVSEEVAGHAVVQPAAALATFLQAQHLTNGVGDYWSASITTLESDGMVKVRPIIGSNGKLLRYSKNSANDWYAGVRFNFFVYEPTSIWNGDTARAAQRAWGPPSRIWHIGPYKVLVFPHYFSISASGSTGP
jgi:hypothetical protein